MKKKVCIVTATRAEYGLLRTLMYRIAKSSSLSLQLIVTGTHLERAYGETIKEIEADGFSIDAIVPIYVNSTSVGIIETMSNATRNIGVAICKLKPDMLIILGDRYEALAVAASAVILGIPVAHIHGGEVTYGAFDDMFRHAITKLSYIHFTSTEEYRKRVIQMGENPDRVYNVGALGVENILKTKLLNLAEIERILDMQLEKTFLVTFHPVTMEVLSQKDQIAQVIAAFEEFESYNFLFTRPNADTNSGELNLIIDDFKKRNDKRVKVVDSLGSIKYLSTMKYCRGVIGNSSSGIIEAPSMRVGTVNIGNRQKGRISASSVIHCKPEKMDIIKAMNTIQSKEFTDTLSTVENPYEGNETSAQIVMQIEKTLFDVINTKEFYDIKFKV